MNNKKEPQPPLLTFYCFECGRQLLVKPINQGFLIKSGEKIADWKWSCPLKRFWNWHTQFCTDQDGSSYPFEA
jgi:hypothetical protein